jgi:hypothetical protein
MIGSVYCSDCVGSMCLILTGIQVSIESWEVAAGNFEP